MYKILSLDGGGSWSILQLLTLHEKYGDAKGHDVLQDFDLVIANSGGSLVLAALAENWTITKALTLFKDKEVRQSIFSKNSFRERFFPVDYIGSFFGPKYSSKRKGQAFKTLFSDIDKLEMKDLPNHIGKSSLKFIVCTYDALNNKAKFFRSYKLNPSDVFDSVRLTQAIHGSSNAPVLYFDFPARFKAKESNIWYELWDGALGGFNNPVAAGLIEAIKLGVEIQEVKIVSLGTGNKTMSMKDKDNFYNLKHNTIKERFNKWKVWKLKSQLNFFKTTILNQAKTILYQPPDWANYVTLTFMQHAKSVNINEQFIRLSPMIHSDKKTSPSAQELISRLYHLDMDIVADKDIQTLIEGFNSWKKGEIPNQPIEYYIERDNTLVHKIGHKTFNEAMSAW